MIKGYLCGHRCGSRLTALTASLLFAIQLAVPTFAESPGTASETLDLESGAVATLYAGGLSRFEVQDRRVAIVERQGRLNLRVRAKSPGSTFLQVWTTDEQPHVYEIRVRPGTQDLLTHRSQEAAPPQPSAEQAYPSKAISMMDSAALASRTQSQASVHSIASKPGHRPMDLFVGAVSTTRAGEVKRIVMGNDLIAEASILDDGELLVLGKSPGITELQVLTEASGTHEYLVRVYPAPPADALDLLRIALLPFPDLAIESKLGRLIVTGTVDAADFERYTSVVRGFPTVLSTVTPQLNVLIEPSVVLDVAVLEVNRSYQKTVGVRWQDTASGPATGIVGNLVPNNVIGVVSDVGTVTNDLQDLLGAVGSGTQRLSGYLGITSIFGSEIQLLQEEGLARVLAAPSLSTVSGEQATFLAGGDFPVAILNQFGHPVIEFREFGVQLEIQPVVDRNLNIRSKIRAEVSSVDFTTQVNGVPGLLRRETVSTITARPGETIILSGLLDARDSRNVDKVPGLGNIPILGALFRSDDFIKQRTELIITVTPRIQKPNQPLSPEMQAADHHLRKRLLSGSKGIDQALISADPTTIEPEGAQ
tara:strand:- start:3459 stop:5234 length:1776 start_codon:yes stop_codon:yes gene_type:complete